MRGEERKTGFGAGCIFWQARQASWRHVWPRDGLMAAPAAAQRPERPALDITGYVIDAELDTSDAPPDGQGGGELYGAAEP